MKYFDTDRVIVSLIVYILLIGTGIFLFVVGVLPTYLESFQEYPFRNSISIFVYVLIFVIYTNFMFHIVMESNANTEFRDKSFLYKTLLRFGKIEIHFREVKKIIICQENLVFHGDYESMIVIRKGLRRNIFFTEFSMKKDQYSKLKEFLTHIDPEKVVITKKRYIKPLLALFGK